MGTALVVLCTPTSVLLTEQLDVEVGVGPGLHVDAAGRIARIVREEDLGRLCVAVLLGHPQRDGETVISGVDKAADLRVISQPVVSAVITSYLSTIGP